ncbi:MAG: hypothetical protein WC329_08245 [Candidatus Omnitrophota bacterium]|jgi:hypothetical protein
MERVIFRKWRGKSGDVIALFPDIKTDVGGYLCQSYEHVGQHAAADYGLVVGLTAPAQPAEYADLAAELREIGYDLDIRKRRPS